MNDKRTRSYAQRVVFPTIPVSDKGFKECCYENLVLADLNSSGDYKNDYTGFWHFKQISTETCIFTLIELSTLNEFIISDGTYGVFTDFGGFPTQSELTGFKVEWKKVLTLLGEGAYQIRKDIDIAGNTFEILSNTFTLRQFNQDVADKTTRIDIVMNGRLTHYNNANFIGTDWKTSIRTRGFFGRRNPKYEQDNIVYGNLEREQNSMKQVNEYLYEAALLPSCITDELFDFILFGYPMYANDYNLNNHSYGFVKYPIELDKNSGTDYYSAIRDAKINLVFKDPDEKRQKRTC